MNVPAKLWLAQKLVPLMLLASAEAVPLIVNGAQKNPGKVSENSPVNSSIVPEPVINGPSNVIGEET